MMRTHCRCAKRADKPDQWDFAPNYHSLKGQAAYKLAMACALYARFTFTRAQIKGNAHGKMTNSGLLPPLIPKIAPE